MPVDSLNAKPWRPSREHNSYEQNKKGLQARHEIIVLAERRADKKGVVVGAAAAGVRLGRGDEKIRPRAVCVDPVGRPVDRGIAEVVSALNRIVYPIFAQKKDFGIRLFK